MLLLSVFFRSIKQIIRSTPRIVLIIFFPLGFVAVFAFIFGGGDLGVPSSMVIGVVNTDESSIINQWREEFSNYTEPWSSNTTLDPFTYGFGNLFIESIKGQTGLKLINKTFKTIMFENPSDAILSIRSRALTLVIHIPYDFSAGVLSGINSKETILSGIPIVNESMILTKNVTITVFGDPIYVDFQNTLTEIQTALKIFKDHFFGINIQSGGIFTTSFESVVSYELTQFDYFISGFFTFSLILSSSSIAGTLGDEREYRTLDRLKLSDIRPFELMGGITLNQIATGGIQLAMMFVAAYILGFGGKGDPFIAYLVGILTIIPVLGLGFLVSAFVPNGRDASGVIAVLSAPIGFMSGAFLSVPEVTLIPNFIPTSSGTRALQLWDLFPFYSSVNAIRNTLLFDHNLMQILPDILLLIIGGLIFFIVGAVFFLWRVFQPEK